MLVFPKFSGTLQFSGCHRRKLIFLLFDQMFGQFLTVKMTNLQWRSFWKSQDVIFPQAHLLP